MTNLFQRWLVIILCGLVKTVNHMRILFSNVYGVSEGSNNPISCNIVILKDSPLKHLSKVVNFRVIKLWIDSEVQVSWAIFQIMQLNLWPDCI